MTAKLDEDYTYQLLQKKLRNERRDRDMIEKEIQRTLEHINAIKRNYLAYELECQNE